MTRFSCHVQIAAPARRVFATFTDLRRAPEYVTGIERVEVLDEAPVGVGTRFRETRVLYGRRATEEIEITRFEPPRRFVAEARAHGAHFVSDYRFEPCEAGTRVTLEFTARPHSLLARALAFLSRAMAGSLRRTMEQDLADLKRVAEAKEA